LRASSLVVFDCARLCTVLLRDVGGWLSRDDDERSIRGLLSLPPPPGNIPLSLEGGCSCGDDGAEAEKKGLSRIGGLDRSRTSISATGGRNGLL